MRRYRSEPLRIYLAAPLFSDAELRFNERAERALASCGEVFLPQRDGALLTELVLNGMPRELAVQHVFSVDLAAIEACDVLVLVMDGRTVDEGACFELGYAFAIGRVCIGLQTDPRRLLPEGNNPMLDSALLHRFSSLEDLQRFLKGRSAVQLSEEWQMLKRELASPGDMAEYQ